jgi:hypothetical protein
MNATTGRFISSFEGNGNKITLALEYDVYVMYWAKKEDEPKNREELIYPNGRKYSYQESLKHFIKATEACQHIIFSKV